MTSNDSQARQDVVTRQSGSQAAISVPCTAVPGLQAHSVTTVIRDVRPAGDGSVGKERRSARPAVEIYVAGDLADVVVDTYIALQILRGARRVVRNGRQLAIAWGRFPADGSDVAVTFVRDRLSPVARSARVFEVASWCWLAVAEGRYDRVTVTDRGTGERHGRRFGRR